MTTHARSSLQLKALDNKGYLVGFLAALLVQLDQLVLAGAGLDTQVEAGMKYYQKTIHNVFLLLELSLSLIFIFFSEQQNEIVGVTGL